MPSAPLPRPASLGIAVAAVALVSLPAVGLQAQAGTATAAATQAASTQPPTTLSAAEIRALAEAHVAVSLVHDSSDARSAQARNKTHDAQRELAAKKQALVTDALKAKGLTDAQYRQQRFLVSTNLEMRAQFDSVVAKLTGAPIPGRVAAAVAPGTMPASALPAGLVGTHVGHIVTSFVDTPDKVGLLSIAFTEAAVAAQHATLATRTPTDLAAMQLHAGHVLHALDPAQMASGPGKGFGMKRGANGAAQHIELAAKEPTASGNIKVHANHIATAARAAAARADQAIALVKQIQAAKEASEAAKLITQLVSICGQLAAGADSNADGRVDWGNGEGGLQQAFEHVQLMVAGERR